MRIKMLHRKDLKDVGLLTVIVFIPVAYDWIENSTVSWHLVALWCALVALLLLPKQLMSYVSDSNEAQVVLRESLLSRQAIISRDDISSVELYEVDRKPIGLRIVCKDDSVITFVPLRFDVALLERIRLFILERKS